MKHGIWICADETPSSAKLYYFQKSFNTQKGASLIANICADSRYKLYVNGKFVCDGPCRGSHYERFYETVDLTQYLIDGENTIEARVLYLTDGMFISIIREYHPALWFEGILTQNGINTRISTNQTWTCRRLENHTFTNGRGVHPSMPSVEFIDGEDIFTDVKVRYLCEATVDREGCYNEWGCRDRYPLTPRTIPLMSLSEPKQFKVVKKGNNYIDIDAGKYTTAMVNVSFKGKKGSKLTISYNECYTHDNGQKDLRDDITGDLNEPYVDTIILTGEKQQFTSFSFRAFRYVRLNFEDKDIKIDLNNTNFECYFYPMDEIGTFECSNDSFNKIWDISVNTIKCCMHEIYVDCPHYEQQQYGMDSAIETQLTYRITNDTRMQRKCISDLAQSQLPDGMLQANYPSTGVQVIPTFSLYWVLMLREYLRHTDDKKFVSQYMGTMDKIFDSLDRTLTSEGLVGKTPYWHFVDWVPGWPIGIPTGGDNDQVTVYSLIYSTALKAGAEICNKLGKSSRADEYNIRADKINNAVNQYCYDNDKQMYYDTLKCKTFSEHTALWAILSGAVNGNKAAGLIDRIMNTEIPRCSFSMNYYMFRALEKAERYSYSPKLMSGWQKMLDLHCTTWCENPDSPRSECHGWSSAPIYEFSGMILGIQPDEDGYKSIIIRPHFEYADWAKGTIPTPYGIISVSWKKIQEKTILDVSLPKNVKIPSTIILPGQPTIHTTDSNIHIEF